VTERDRPDGERGIAEEAVEALIRLARADFTVRLPRTFSKDTDDVLAMFINLIAEELDRLSQRAVVEAILDSMVDGVLLLEADGSVRRANRAVANLLAWPSAAELLGLPFEQLVAPRDRTLASRLAAAGALPLRDRDVLFVTKSGALVPMAVNASPVLGAGGAPDGTVIVMRDDRELKQARAHLQLSDRLTTMGMLAAGVAHEINNPLAFVSSNLDFVVDELSRTAGRALEADEHAEIVKALRASQTGAERVRLIVRDLHAFSRVEESAVARLDVARLLDSALSMLRSEIRNRARVEKKYGSVPPVDANEARLVQVFLNLIQNAAQAIPPGAATKNEIRLATRTSDDGEVVVEVRDTGGGISSENLVRIFDPFFSTKPVGVGTGLGLAISDKIVRSFGGRIEVETQLGVGSTFRVVLPPSGSVEAGAPSSRRSPPAPRASAPRRRVLVVDDEAEIGDSLKRLLGAAHDVVSATRGADALALLQGGTFDVILCDLVMPEMTGMDVYRRLSSERPEIAERVVFMTGANIGGGLREFLAGVPNACIEKPFDRARVFSVVESMR
jgi:PAS domain S-box-containing protein